MPFVAWGNGACTLDAGQYERFLVEVASWGYVVAADGAPSGGGGTAQQSKVQDMRDSIEWAFKGGAKKYGNVDVGRTTTAGHSCGGLEAMSVAYHDERYVCVRACVWVAGQMGGDGGGEGNEGSVRTC